MSGLEVKQFVMAKFGDILLKCIIHNEQVPCEDLFFGRMSVSNIGIYHLNPPLIFT